MGFLPIGDDNSRRRTLPFVVWGLVAVNAAVWLLQTQLGPEFTNGYACVPREITTGQDLVGTQHLIVEQDGQRVEIPVEEGPGPRPIQLTLLTAMFMHGSWMHIIGNMLYMVIFADQIEDLLGHVRFVFFYLLCGLAAGLAQVFYSPDSIIPCLGASGAIAGCLGAYLVRFPTNGVRVIVGRTLTVLPAWMVLGGWIALQLLSQVGTVGNAAGGGVAYLAHIGGFATGVVLVFLLAIGRPPPEPTPARYDRFR
jgi:membrane associated rhomboid family serine protease